MHSAPEWPYLLVQVVQRPGRALSVTGHGEIDMTTVNALSDTLSTVLRQEKPTHIDVNLAELAIALVRAQASDFQGETPEWLQEHARRVGEPALQLGYSEFSANVVPIRDPSDQTHVLDTWYEVGFERTVPDAAALVVEFFND